MQNKLNQINTNYDSNNINMDLEMNKQYSVSYTYNSLSYENEISCEIIREYQEAFRNNKLLYISYSIMLYITHFCQTTHYLLSSLKASDEYIVKEYIRRYNSFIDFAINFNEQLENINVMLNYSYDYIFKNRPLFVKFSFLRMFIIIWNNEVLLKLTDIYSELILIDKVNSLFYTDLIREYTNQICNQMEVDNTEESNIFTIEQ